MLSRVLLVLLLSEEDRVLGDRFCGFALLSFWDCAQRVPFLSSSRNSGFLPAMSALLESEG